MVDDEVRITISPQINKRVIIQEDEPARVVRLGEQGPIGTSGDINLSELADVFHPTIPIDDGSLLVYDSTNQRWFTTTILEQGQTIIGGEF